MLSSSLRSFLSAPNRLPVHLTRIMLLLIDILILHVAICLGLVGAVLVCCPQSSFLYRLLHLDMYGPQIMALHKLFNMHVFNLAADLPSITFFFRCYLQNLGMVILLFSMILMSIAIVGCYGVVTKSARWMDIFSLLSGAGLLISSLLFLGVIMRSQVIGRQLERNLYVYIANDYTPFPAKSAMDDNVVDFFQSRLSCCGVLNVSDYEAYSIPRIPQSCCKLFRFPFRKTGLLFARDPNCGHHPNTRNSYAARGCFDVILNYVRETISRFIFMFWIMCVVGVSASVLFQWSLKTSTYDDFKETRI